MYTVTIENSKHRFSFICGPLFTTPESFFNFLRRFKLFSPVKIASMRVSTSGARPSFQLYEARDLETISP